MKHVMHYLAVIITLSMILSACAPSAAQVPAEPTVSSEVSTSETESKPSESEAVEAPAVIKIGGLYPLTGSMALNGQNHQKAHDFAIKEINEAGGIKCLGGAKLEMVYADHQGKPEVGNSEMERLITKEDVVAVMGVFDSGVGLTSTEISEQYKIPYIVSSGVVDAFVERGLKYVFKTAEGMNRIAGDGVQFAKEKGAINGLVLVPNNAIGEFAGTAFSTAMDEKGVTKLEQVTYPGGGTDFTDAILAVKAQDPEVIFAMGDTGDNILLLKQMKELNYWPKLGFITNGGGFSDPTFLESAGADAVEGIFVVQDWYPSLETAGSKETNEAFKEAYGIDLTGGLSTTYASTWLLAAALEKSCSADPEKLAEVLRSETFGEGKWNMLVPSIKFDEKGQNETTPYILAQWQSGELVPVYPDLYKVGEAIWPMPGWGER